MSETSGIKDPSHNLDDSLVLAPAADISHVEQGNAKQSQPSVRDNVLAFCIVFCQLVQVSQLSHISSLAKSFKSRAWLNEEAGHTLRRRTRSSH